MSRILNKSQKYIYWKLWAIEVHCNVYVLMGTSCLEVWRLKLSYERCNSRPLYLTISVIKLSLDRWTIKLLPWVYWFHAWSSCQEPVPNILARPSPSDILEWRKLLNQKMLFRSSLAFCGVKSIRTTLNMWKASWKMILFLMGVWLQVFVSWLENTVVRVFFYVLVTLCRLCFGGKSRNAIWRYYFFSWSWNTHSVICKIHVSL